MEGIIHDGDAGGSDQSAFLTGQLGKTLLSSLGGENAAVGAQQAGHGFEAEHHRIAAGFRHLSAQLLQRFLYGLLCQLCVVNGLRLAQPELEVVAFFFVLADHRHGDQTGDPVHIAQIHALGIADGKAVFFGNALGDRAVHHRFVGFIHGLLGSQHRLHQTLGGGQGNALVIQRLIALSALTQKHRIIGL